MRYAYADQIAGASLNSIQMMKAVILILSLTLNLMVLLYSYFGYSESKFLMAKFEARQKLMAPTDEEWVTLSDPKHLPFLREHIGRLTSNVNDYSGAAYKGAKALRSQSEMHWLSAILNIALFGVFYLKWRKAEPRLLPV
jgi:hypothetical protein